MDRVDGRPLTVAEAKQRLRETARAGDRSGALGGGVLAVARRRPLAAVGAALAVGIAFGASRRVRTQVLTTLLRMLR